MKRGREREESKEGSVRIEVFVIPGIGLLMLGRGYIIHRLKMQYFLKKYSSLQPGIDQTN